MGEKLAPQNGSPPSPSYNIKTGNTRGHIERNKIAVSWWYCIKLERFSILHSLIINLEQTPTKYVPVGRTTLPKKNTKTVPIKGSSNKRTITATLAILLQGDFLPMQLTYGGKTRKCLPRFKFPEKFFWVIMKHTTAMRKKPANSLKRSCNPTLRK